MGVCFFRISYHAVLLGRPVEQLEICRKNLTLVFLSSSSYISGGLLLFLHSTKLKLMVKSRNKLIVLQLDLTATPVLYIAMSIT